MKLHQLKSTTGSTHRKRRVGRGIGSGRGTFCGRGGKGQTARAGGNRRIGFEGGQTPLTRRLPKLGGFKNINRVPFQVVNLSDLEKEFDNSAEVSASSLKLAGLIRSDKNPVKILGVGELSKKLIIKVESISASAKEKIEKAGGKIEILPSKSKKKVKTEKIEKN